MDLSAPFQSMFPAVDSAVLAVLAGSANPRTGREVARAANRSQDATQRVLDRLVEHGLVRKREAGSARVYELNLDHVAAEPVIGLATLRSRLFQRLQEELGSWEPTPFHASVFGSAVRGDGGIDSDVDIFLVRPDEVEEENEKWRGHVEALADHVFEWTGNHAGIAEVAEDDLDRLRKEQPAILGSLHADALDIAGVPLRSFLKRIR
jgi:DNA-binding transcriptional ArsR family regulator